MSETKTKMQMSETKRKKRKRVSEGDDVKEGKRIRNGGFKTDGFEVFQRFLSKRALTLIRSKFDEVYAEKHEDIDPEWVLNLHLDDEKHGQWIKRIACHPKLVSYLRREEHFGPDRDFYLYCSQCSTKPARGECSHVPWHQDGDGTVRTVWIALDDISSKNGGLVVMRGGHDAGRRTLKHVKSQEELSDAIRHAKYNVFAIQDKDIVDKATYAYEFPAGGAGIHHPLLPHMSYRNTTDRARRVLILRYTTDKDAKNDECFLHYRTMKPTPKKSFLVKPYIDENKDSLLLLL